MSGKIAYRLDEPQARNVPKIGYHREKQGFQIENCRFQN
jgi:hypothetical protein